MMPFYLLTALFTLFLQITPASAKSMYKWVDENGRTFFSDQVPPDKSGYERELLNKGGRVVEVIEKAKTKEQIELETRLAKLRKEQEKIISSQKVRDNALLNTFHSKEDMEMAFDVKMQTLDSEKKVLQTQLDNLKGQLADQQRQAAEMERNAQQVSEKLLKDMAITQQQIRQVRDAMNAGDDKRKRMTDEYHADLDRFLFLMKRNKDDNPDAKKIASVKEANELGLFFCENDKQCNKVWELARDFINLHSTTPPDIYNEKLIMNRAPATDEDLSLSLSKIMVDENYELFLDIRCRDSARGRELCSSDKVQAIRAAFRPYINEALSRAAGQ